MAAFRSIFRVDPGRVAAGSLNIGGIISTAPTATFAAGDRMNQGTAPVRVKAALYPAYRMVKWTGRVAAGSLNIGGIVSTAPTANFAAGDRAGVLVHLGAITFVFPFNGGSPIIGIPPAPTAGRMIYGTRRKIEAGAAAGGSQASLTAPPARIIPGGTTA